MTSNSPPQPDLWPALEFGRNQGRGNLVGIQPHMTPRDYVNAAAFQAKLARYLETANQRDWLGDRTIVLFPEHIGTWLVAVGERDRVYSATTVTAAMRHMVLRHPLSLLKGMRSAKSGDRLRDGLFRMKAGETAAIYQSVFSQLAQTYGATVVAGSILLPEARIEDGQLRCGSGPLYNTAVIFGPDGAPHADLVYKSFPTAAEQPFTASAPPDSLPVFETPAGHLGVLICADSWFPESYQVLRAKGAEIVAVPSFLGPDGVWERTWQGYDGQDAPDDVDLSDVGKISEGDAWRKYALSGRLSASGIRAGINVFLRGNLWDLGSDGHTVAVDGPAIYEAPNRNGASITCLWL